MNETSLADLWNPFIIKIFTSPTPQKEKKNKKKKKKEKKK